MRYLLILAFALLLALPVAAQTPTDEGNTLRLEDAVNSYNMLPGPSQHDGLNSHAVNAVLFCDRVLALPFGNGLPYLSYFLVVQLGSAYLGSLYAFARGNALRVQVGPVIVAASNMFGVQAFPVIVAATETPPSHCVRRVVFSSS